MFTFTVHILITSMKFFTLTKIKFSIFIGLILIFLLSQSYIFTASAQMPFYDLQPKELELRASFYTTFSSSTSERKNNIKIAAMALNDAFIDVGGEFSFNDRVGPRTEARGYKKAKIIFNGHFIDGIGGGVCQVSTTLYNAVLLADLSITEYHPHSLPVSYAAPSFDAMVNSGSADLKFVNNTHNPIIIKTFTDDKTIKISIYGEPLNCTITRKSNIIKEIAAPPEEVLSDNKGEYPELHLGERKVLSYSKKGYKSEGIIIKSRDGKILQSKKIRVDTYSAVRGTIIEGTTPWQTDSEDIPEQNYDEAGV